MALGRPKGYKYTEEQKARMWTPERRAAQAEVMRERWVKQKAGQ